MRSTSCAPMVYSGSTFTDASFDPLSTDSPTSGVTRAPPLSCWRAEVCEGSHRGTVNARPARLSKNLDDIFADTSIQLHLLSCCRGRGRAQVSPVRTPALPEIYGRFSLSLTRSVEQHRGPRRDLIVRSATYFFAVTYVFPA